MSPAVRRYLEALAAKVAADLASDQAARDAREVHARLTPRRARGVARAAGPRVAGAAGRCVVSWLDARSWLELAVLAALVVLTAWRVSGGGRDGR